MRDIFFNTWKELLLIEQNILVIVNIFFLWGTIDWSLLKCLGHAEDVENKMISLVGSCFNF